MAGTSEGGKKAAATRGHESLSEAGRKGGQQSHQRSASSNRDNESSSDRGHRGGQQAHGGNKQGDNR